jgi:molecular chaperone GrpE
MGRKDNNESNGSNDGGAKNKQGKKGDGEERKTFKKYRDLSKSLEKKWFKKESKKKLAIEELEEEIELLGKQLDDYKKIEDDYLDRVKRLQADYDNYRKRTLKEQLEHIKSANKELIEKLLPVIDSFEHALEVGKDLKSADDEFCKGVNMIYGKLIDVLKGEGIEIINPKGEEFNPHLCEAAVTEAKDNVSEGIVLEVLRKGYKIGNFLIRPAVVKVCKK